MKQLTKCEKGHDLEPRRYMYCNTCKVKYLWTEITVTAKRHKWKPEISGKIGDLELPKTINIMKGGK